MRRSIWFILILCVFISGVGYGSDWMARPGTTRNAISLPDGAGVSLDAVTVELVIAPYFFVRDPWKDSPMLAVYGDVPMSRWSTIDLSGTLTTIAGQRVLIASQVSVYTDSHGKVVPVFAKGPREPYQWLNKLNIAVPSPSNIIPAPPAQALPNHDDPAPTFAPTGTIADAKLPDEMNTRSLDSVPQMDGGAVDLNAKIVTAVLLTEGTGALASFYVQEPLRGGNGIRVIPQRPCMVAKGDLVHIVGKVIDSSQSNAECYVSAATVERTGSGQVPAPVGISARTTASGAFGRQQKLYLKSDLSCSGAGLSLLGSRVRMWGRVTWKSQDARVCFIDDGSGMTSSYSGTLRTGIRVIWPAGTAAPHQIGDFVAGITGVLGAEYSEDTPARAVPVLRIPNRLLMVRQGATSPNNGESWATSYSSIQQAIDAANYGDQIMVAQGNYNESIVLKAGVALFGGFPVPSGVNSTAARDPRTYTTMISAVAGTSAVTAVGDPDAPKTIDGFYITNGSGTAINGQRCGGGIYCSNAWLVAANNTIHQNGTTGTLPVLGAGVYVAENSNATIKSSRIDQNGSAVTGSSGAGIYCTNSALLAASNLVCDNVTAAGGSSVYCSGSGDVSLINNTISGAHGHSAIFCSDSSPDIFNNIIASADYGVYNSGLGAPSLDYNCLWDNTNAYYEITPGQHDIYVDPLLAMSDYGDYHIDSDSPCVDAGKDTIIQSDWSDQDGGLRLTNSHVDIGAYETETAFVPAPSAPIVSADDFTNADSALSASWEMDETSDVAGYRFAIGTSDTDTGADYVHGWEETSETSASVNGLSLVEGTTYYWYVQAKNHDGVWGQAGVSSGTLVDFTAPDPGTFSVPEVSESTPIIVSYADATDNLSGLELIELWYQKDGGEWINSGVTSSGESGALYFEPLEEGTYNFWLVAEDYAGNRSAEPSLISAPSFSGPQLPTSPTSPTGGTVFSKSTTIGGRPKTIIWHLFEGGPVTKVDVYDANGSNASTVGYTYGNEGELLGLTGDADKATVTYDPLYRLKSIKDGLQRESNLKYDIFGTLTSASFPEHSGDTDTTTYDTYDDQGRLTQSTDPNKKTWGYDYESGNDGLLTDVNYPGTNPPSIHFTYSPDFGELTSVTQDGVMSKSYDYDDFGVLRSVTTTYNEIPGKSWTVSYDYWSDGSLRKMTLPNGHYYWYEYDLAGRISVMSRKDAGGVKQESVSWTYPTLTSGNVGTQTVRNGSGAIVSKTTYRSDRRGMLMSLVNEDGGGVISSFEGAAGRINYDGLGNIKAIKSNISGSAALSGIVNYSYNRLSQLTREDSDRGIGFDTSFLYDDAGNATTFESVTRNYNECNQSLPSSLYVYDSNGNPTTYKGMLLKFDVDNQMTSYNNGVMTAGYGVDGLRIWKKVGENAKRYYLYAGGVPVCELSGTGEVIAINSFGPTGLISRDEIVYNQIELHYFYTFDPLGNVCQIQNEDGVVIYKEGYDAYGSPIFGSDPNPTPFGYGGQAGYYTDNETGLILCSARYYDPADGRWLTRDPIGYDGGLNVYAYCDGNPVGRLDPSGASAEEWPLVVAAKEVVKEQKETFIRVIEGNAAAVSTASTAVIRVVEGGAARAGAALAGGAAAAEGVSVSLVIGTIAVESGALTLLAASPAGDPDSDTFSGKDLPRPQNYLFDVADKHLLSTSEKRSIRSLEKEIAKHKAKLEEYIKNPDANDNKNFLRNAEGNELLREQIIRTRIQGLEREIVKFQNQIGKILGRVRG